MRRPRWLRTIIVATALVAVASLCHLSTLYDETQARVADQGNYCTRVGRTYNIHGELVEEGLWWGPDNERHGVDDGERWEAE